MRNKPFGIYDPGDWLTEGDGLLESARIVRRSWSQRRRSFSKAIESSRARAAIWHALTGMPRAYMLLVGYAAEMFLKAGLCKALQNCDEGVLDRGFKEFGHKLSYLADEIAIALSNEEIAYLDQLENLITDARYPVVAENSGTYIATKNEQTYLIWNDQEFRTMEKLVAKIRQQVDMIDRDSANPSFCCRMSLEKGGYVTFRTGGHLPTRFMFSSRDLEFGVHELEKLILSDPRLVDMQFYWKQASIYRIDQRSRTTLIRLPLT